MRIKNMVVAAALLCSCSREEQKPTDFYTSAFFHDVQMKAVFPDSKTFVDCTPKKDLSEIILDYEKVKDAPDLDLKAFVNQNFDLPVRPKSTFATDTTLVMEEH